MDPIISIPWTDETMTVLDMNKVKVNGELATDLLAQRDEARARVAELEARISDGQTVLKRRNEECDLYRGALLRCASAAGNPDPATGCRLVIYFVNEVIE